MKLFVSWSGERSQALAQSIRDWLPMVLHYVEPWISNSDIEAGERWASQVAKELEATQFGLICVTKENINSPWILFEAGALAKSMQEGRVVPLLLDIEFKDIAGPLAQFQAKKVEKSGLNDVIKAINQQSEIKVPEARLGPLFDTLWPALEKKVTDIPKGAATVKSNRSQSEVLEELVSSIRGLDLRFRESNDIGPRYRRKRPNFHPMMIKELTHRSKLGRRDPTHFLVLGSMFKDEFPWLYELGVDAYREGLAGDSSKYRGARRRFLDACEVIRRGPYMISDKDSFAMINEMISSLEFFNFENHEEARAEAGLREKQPFLIKDEDN